MVHHEPYEQQLPATARSLAEFRRTLRIWLEGEVVYPDRRADIVLAASELAAAAIRAVPDNAAVAVSVWADDGAIVVESRAESGAGGFADRPARVFEGNDGERGFSIVAALSEIFAVKGMPTGVVVRARVRCERFAALAPG